MRNCKRILCSTLCNLSFTRTLHTCAHPRCNRSCADHVCVIPGGDVWTRPLKLVFWADPPKGSPSLAASLVTTAHSHSPETRISLVCDGFLQKKNYSQKILVVDTATKFLFMYTMNICFCTRVKSFVLTFRPDLYSSHNRQTWRINDDRQSSIPRPCPALDMPWPQVMGGIGRTMLEWRCLTWETCRYAGNVRQVITIQPLDVVPNRAIGGKIIQHSSFDHSTATVIGFHLSGTMLGL